MDYPRKRALVACNFCRHRKRKCDGQKPVCGFCANAGARCEYQENPSEKSDSDPPVEIVSRLKSLEDLVQQQTQIISTLSERLSSTAANNDLQSGSASNYSRGRSISHASSAQSTVNGDDSTSVDPRMLYEHNEEGPLGIPLGHQTPTASLLMLEQIKYLIGDYPQNFFLSQESGRILRPLVPRLPFSTVLERLNVRHETTEFLVAAFFSNIHSQFPLLERHAFLDRFNKFLKTSQCNTVTDALCLTVLALGEICSTTIDIFDAESRNGSNGTEYFSHAQKVLNGAGMAIFRKDPMAPLAFFFASVYFRYRGRPLEAWRHIHTASTGIQLVFSQLHGTGIPSEQHAMLTRIAWGCYVLECDDLAEFQFPRSGIEILVDRLPFPEFADPGDRNNLVFLAMCSIRKILNRIHSTMYSSKFIETQKQSFSAHPHQQHQSVTSLESINVELHRQLNTWFESLPESIKPDLRNLDPGDLHSSQLQTRFYAAKHIICRPCLIYAAQQQSAQLSGFVMTNCETCVDSCQKFIHGTVPLLKRRTPSTWLRLQALLAAVCVLSMARSTPSLAFLVPDFEATIAVAIECTEPWARNQETVDAILNIFKSIRQKLRLLPELH